MFSPIRDLPGQQLRQRPVGSPSRIRCPCVTRSSPGAREERDVRVEGVRLTEFRELLTEEFGSIRGNSLLTDHVLSGIGRTGAQAIEEGVDPREVWRSICYEFDVPKERW